METRTTFVRSPIVLANVRRLFAQLQTAGKRILNSVLAVAALLERWGKRRFETRCFCSFAGDLKRELSFSRITRHPEVGLFGVKLTKNARPFLVTHGVPSALSVGGLPTSM